MDVYDVMLNAFLLFNASKFPIAQVLIIVPCVG